MKKTTHTFRGWLGGHLLLAALAGALVAGCDHRAAGGITPDRSRQWLQVGQIHAATLNEISGIQAISSELLVVHNDDGAAEIHVIDLAGTLRASITLEPARNRDWEDISIIPTDRGPRLVLGDFGDNLGRHRDIQLYLTAVPPVASDAPLQNPSAVEHVINLRYPDGPRDCEAMAYDPVSDRVLLLTKRDQPPRLYGIDRASLLHGDEATLQLLGTLPVLRPPTLGELLTNPLGAWISQPTGFDISTDGRLAAVLTYRSLYLFERRADEAWSDTFLRQPWEIIGPPGFYEEAVTFTAQGNGVIVTTEKLPAPIYRLNLDWLKDQSVATP